MKSVWRTLGLLGLTCMRLNAQVTVEVVLDQEQFLRDESLAVKVRITNRSGQSLALGDGNEWLKFRMEGREGQLVATLSPVPVERKFTLESSQVATRLVDLMPHYDLTPGRYAVSATVRVRELDQEVTSKPKSFEIIQGITLWHEVVGVPRPNAPPEARKFSLQQARYLRQPYLYVRLTDVTDHVVYRVLPIGPLLSFSKPETQIDRQSQLHVLFQTGPRAFTYAVVDPHGELVLRQRHEISQSRPALKGAPDGNVVVAGGARQPSRSDIPPSADSIPTP